MPVSRDELMAWQDDPDTFTDTDAYRAARDAVLEELGADPRLYEPEELYPVVEAYTGSEGLPRDAWDLLYEMYLVEDAIDIVFEEQPSAATPGPSPGSLDGAVTGMYYAIATDHL